MNKEDLNYTGQIKEHENCDNCNNCNQFEADTQKSIRVERNVFPLVIPAGAYYVDIVNSGLKAIKVNGQIVSPRGEYHADVRTNQISSKQDFVEEITIEQFNNQDSKYWLKVSYPSNSGQSAIDSIEAQLNI